MPDQDPQTQVEAARTAFESDFGPFAQFRVVADSGLTLREAEQRLRELGDLRTQIGRASCRERV